MGRGNILGLAARCTSEVISELTSAYTLIIYQNAMIRIKNIGGLTDV